MQDVVAESYAFCREISRRTARNFYYSFLTLPTPKFRAMCALYAYMRLVDDLGDDLSLSETTRAENLHTLRHSLRHCLDNPSSAASVRREIAHQNVVAEPSSLAAMTTRIMPALVEVVRDFQIPPQYLFDVIDGVEKDLRPVRFETFSDLSDYCYQVAGVVGLCSIHIWGFHDERALQAAIPCGLAMQLTNILRDLKEDAAAGRIYLPREDLARFGYRPEDLSSACQDERFAALMQFEVARTREFYAQARELFEYLEPAGRPILETMLCIYGGLLDEIERRNYDVFTRRVQLSTWRKLCYTAKGIVRQQWATYFSLP